MIKSFKLTLILGFFCSISLETHATQQLEGLILSVRSPISRSLRHFSANLHQNTPPAIEHKRHFSASLHQNTPPAIEHKKYYAGLSIDGAGMKGAVYIRVLQDIEKRLQDELGEQDKKDEDKTRLHDAFDFIGGTCVGSIITLSLTTPNSTPKRPHPLVWWESEFRNNRDRVFPSTFFNTIKQWVWGVRYSSTEDYAEVLRESFGDLKLSDTLTDVVVTSIQFKDAKPFLFTREQARNDESCDYYLKDMALASTAMFSQYPPMTIKSVSGKETPVIMDAFTSYNNSSQLVYNMLQKKTDAARDEILMVSIGGLEDIYDTKTSTGLLWILPKQLSLFRVGAGSGARSEMQRLLGKEGFVRISPDPDLAKIKYNNTSKKVEDTLNKAAAEIIRYQSGQLQYIAETLAQIVKHKRQGRPKGNINKPSLMKEESKKRYNILSIDGGGIRGIIPANILKQIEETTEQPIHKLFDFIGGTSVGGLIACGLTTPQVKDPTKPRYSAEYVAQLLEGEERVRVFTPHWKGLGTYFRQAFSSAYISTPFEKLLQDKFDDTLLSDALTNVVITATDHKSKNLVLFSKKGRETGVESVLEGKYYVKDVVRATSAAPSFFIPGKIMEIRPTGPKNVDYIDGGICCNNPTQLTWNSLQIQYPDANTQNTLVLSLGTGQGPMPCYRPSENSSLSRWTLAISEYFMRGHSYAVHHDMQHMFGENYMFIRPDIEKKIGLADVSQKNVDNLKKVVKEVVTKDEINNISYRLLKNKGLEIPKALEEAMKVSESKS